MNKLKFLLPFIAVIFAVAGVFAMRANKKSVKSDSTTLYFHYIPNTMSETDYETPGSWELSDPEDADCDEGDITCLVHVEDTQLSGVGPQNQQFANFLANQDPTSSDGATTYVSENLSGTKTAH